MAHKGKFYKLWFRRDAAWSVDNYRQAFPEAYGIQFSQIITSSRYATALLPHVLGINLSKEYERIWRSEPVGGFFDGCYWEVEIASEPNDDYTRWWLRIVHPAPINVPLLTVLYDVQHRPVSPFNPVLGGQVELRFLSPDINVNPANLITQLVAAGYDRYDP